MRLGDLYLDLDPRMKRTVEVLEVGTEYVLIRTMRDDGRPNRSRSRVALANFDKRFRKVEGPALRVEFECVGCGEKQWVDLVPRDDHYVVECPKCYCPCASTGRAKSAEGGAP